MLHYDWISAVAVASRAGDYGWLDRVQHNATEAFEASVISLGQLNFVEQVVASGKEHLGVIIDPELTITVHRLYKDRNRKALYAISKMLLEEGDFVQSDYVRAALEVIRGGVWVDCICGFRAQPGDRYCGGCGRFRGTWTREKELRAAGIDGDDEAAGEQDCYAGERGEPGICYAA